MNTGKILDRTRIRQTHNSFGFVPHRFLRDGFLSSLDPCEALLYLFYILAADRYGISYYSDRKMCDLLNFSGEQLRHTRDRLMEKELICCEDPVCQVLELPYQPVKFTVESSRAGSFSDLKERISREVACKR